MEGKTTRDLMKVLQEKHGIHIQEDKQQALLNMGYFHGFKGYRFIKKSENRIPYRNFDEVIAIYQFDKKVKTIFYPYIMQIETALKNITLDTIIGLASADFAYVFENLLNDYNKHTPGDKDFKKKMKNRLELRNIIYNTISYNYRMNQSIIQHFIHKNKPVPLWAIFEVISLGDFGFFIHCLNKEARVNIAKSLSIYSESHDQKVRVLEDMIFLIKDFRNAVAHDGVVFDCRFQLTPPPNRCIQFLQSETAIDNITFEVIIDYVILHIYLMNKIDSPQKDIQRLIRTFTVASERLRKKLPASIYSSIMGKDVSNKMMSLKSLVT